MINIKLILCALLAYGSVRGMEQEIARETPGLRLDLLIGRDGLLIRARDSDGFPFLCKMIKSGGRVDMPFLREFIARGGDINQRVESQRGDLVNSVYQGTAALHLACSKGNSQLIKDLVECGADVTMITQTGATCLHWLCASDTYKEEAEKGENLIALLVKRGALPNAKKHSDGRVAIMNAIECERIAICKQLIPYGAAESDDVLVCALRRARITSNQETQKFYLDLWLDHKRKPYLYTLWCTLNRYGIPNEVKRIIFRSTPTLLPAHDLPTFYSGQELVQVYAQRDAERESLLADLKQDAKLEGMSAWWSNGKKESTAVPSSAGGRSTRATARTRCTTGRGSVVCGGR